MGWMNWTTPTAVFCIAIFAMLIGMALWETVSPTIERRGFLPMPTTRGDRLFIGLLGSAFIHMIWLMATDMTVWPAFGLSAIYMFIIGRWG